LTRIFNRGALEIRLQQAFASCRQSGLSMALGIVDVDFFKKFNDTYGHQAGDSILRLLAAAMQKLCRPTDLVGRLGGEEFVFLLHHMAAPGAFTFAERLRMEVEGLGKTIHRRFPRCNLTVSVGVATLTPEVACIEELLNYADDSLYHAKNSGRNRVVAWDGKAFTPNSAMGIGQVDAK
jgi:diguanylate cyclase (GGDEF)-like protein